MVGVDIDETLVRAAWRRRRAVWSSQAPNGENTPDVQSASSVAQQRQTTESAASTLLGSSRADYFPLSCEHEFGSLPVPPSVNRGRNMFPHNVSFRTADWITTGIPEDAERYSVVVGYVFNLGVHSGDCYVL